MHRRGFISWTAALLVGLAWASLGGAAQGQTGSQAEVKVSSPTRLDWQFAAREFGLAALKLPADFDSTKQRYQLYVPKSYDPKKAWPLVLFISSGNDPAGWASWRETCERSGVLFCSPYGAGNTVAAGPRTRIILDVLDDVRRRYRTDPDQTYLAGFSGGGRMACTLAFALPEQFGGVIPVCGTNPLPRLTYLRHRVHDRLSVAFATGETDFNRKENEVYMHPQLADLGVRTRLWVVPKLGHGIPPGPVFAELYRWLEEDLARRRQDARTYPGLAAAPSEARDTERETAAHLAAAEGDLKKAERAWRGVALLQGVVARWGKLPVGQKARVRLQQILKDEEILKRVEEQGGADERRTLAAQAKSLERFGRIPQAVQAYEMLVREHPGTPEGKAAASALKRLKKSEE
jgi:predicted esterase